MSKFYIGQKIVAIKDHSQGKFKKGDEFTVFGFGNTCSCGVICIDIGIKTVNSDLRCTTCGVVDTNLTGIHYFNETSFAPIELSSTTFEDVIKENLPCLN